MGKRSSGLYVPAVLLFLLVAHLHACTNVKKDRAAEPAASRYTRLGDLAIHYTAEGSGKPALLFVHGWSCDLKFWRFQNNAVLSAYLKKHFPKGG